MPANNESVKLQLAMAFGHGAGAMLASPEALEKLLAEGGEIFTNAMGDWSANRWAFTELVRTLGQMSSVNAAVAGSPEIRWSDIQKAFGPVMTICPCFVAGVKRPVPHS
jgi:hypothetical protein